MVRYKEFGHLLSEGLKSVSSSQKKRIGDVEWEMATALGYSQHTIQHWRRGYVPKKPEYVQELIHFCVKEGRVDRVWAEKIIKRSGYEELQAVLADTKLFPNQSTAQVRIFMSYQRDIEPNRSIALRIAQALNDPHVVFFAKEERMNQAAMRRSHKELSQADYVIFLLSSESIYSEVILRELELIQQLKAEPDGGPKLLPVWLADQGQFVHGYFSSLEKLKWAFWESKHDTLPLIKELKQAIIGHDLPFTAQEIRERSQKTTHPSQKNALKRPTPSVRSLQLRDGALPPDDPFYVERGADERVRTVMTQQGVTITIKGARQMGKSSLLMRLGRTAEQMGKRFVWLDCHLLKISLSDAQNFFYNFCDELTEQLGLENRLDNQKRAPINALRCTSYVRKEILSRLEQPCVIAFDRAESLFDTSYRDAFFAMLRTWHNNRALKFIWRNLDMVVITSTEPYYFIKDLRQSPFNVGEIIDLQDFTAQQVTDLNARYGSLLNSKAQRALMELVQGHPYLIRRALYLIATQTYTVNQLFAQATEDKGPFGDHLRSLLWLLHTYDPALRKAFRDVIDHHRCDEALFFRLRGAGLVRRQQKRIIPRCPLYADFFQR